MAKRFIDDGIFEDERFAQLSLAAQVLYIGLIAKVADDQGRCEVRPFGIKLAIWPSGSVPLEDVQAALDEIKACDLAVEYEPGWAFLPSWFRHQPKQWPTWGDGPCPEPSILSRWPEYSESLCDQCSEIAGRNKKLSPSLKKSIKVFESLSWTNTNFPSCSSSSSSSSSSAVAVDVAEDTTQAAKSRTAERNAARERRWNAWLDSLRQEAAAAGLTGPRFEEFPDQLTAGLTAYYEARGGGLTPTRKAYLADQLERHPFDVQMFAIECYVDDHAGSKDERYVAGIARRLARYDDGELERDMERHRKRQAGRGIFSATHGRRSHDYEEAAS